MANIGKRRNVYNSTVEPVYVEYPQDASDLLQESPYGSIDLPSDEFYQIHSSRHPPSSRSGSQPRPLFRPQSQQSGPQKSFMRYDGYNTEFQQHASRMRDTCHTGENISIW